MIDWSRVTRAQREYMRSIRERAERPPPDGERCDLPCPVCGAHMRLTLGAFGRYYRCRRRGCTGTQCARLDGTPIKPRKDGPTTWLDKLDTLKIDE